MSIVEQVTGKAEIRYQKHTTGELVLAQVITTLVFLVSLFVVIRTGHVFENGMGLLFIAAFGLAAVINLRTLLVGLRTVTMTGHELVLEYRGRIEHIPLASLEILATRKRKKKDKIKGVVVYRVAGGKQQSLTFNFSKQNGLEAFVTLENIKLQKGSV